MKKTLGLILIFLCLLQAGGLSFIFILQQKKIQYDVRESFRKKNEKLETLILSQEQYLKNKIGKDEIRLDGKMYDIKSIYVSGGKVTLLAKHDTKETNLLKRLSNFFQEDSSPRSAPPQLIQHIGFVYLKPVYDSSLLKIKSSELVFPFFTEPVFSITRSIEIPPPEFS